MTNGGEIVEIKHLEHFTAVVESESFTRAAIRQQVSQPSITLAVQRLEDELGVQLVDRRYKKLTLTEDGKRFYDRTQVILKEVQITVDEMRKNQDVTSFLFLKNLSDLYLCICQHFKCNTPRAV